MRRVTYTIILDIYTAASCCPKSISHHHGVISMGGNKERKEDEQYQYLKQLYPKTRRSRSENKRKICLFNSGNV